MRLAILGSLLVLAACGPAGFGVGGNSDDAAQPTAAPMPADGFEADIAIIPSEQVVAEMSIPEGLSVVSNEDGSITISGEGKVGAASGATTGAAFVIDGDEEARIGGNMVVVRILAKGAEGTTMHVAYSTNDVGNSGWQAFPLTGSFEEYSFKMGVARVNKGGNDYLGFVPKGGDVAIAAVGIDITERPAAPAPAEEPAAAPVEEPADESAPE
ncbi:MAG: hypothetical protein RLN72_07655 [Henriciella sp.]